MPQLSTIMLLAVILSSLLSLLAYQKFRAMSILQNRARLLVALGITWTILWFVMCYVVAIGLYLIDVVV